MLRFLGTALVAVSLVGVLADPAAGQVLKGRTVQARDGKPIPNVEVSLLSLDAKPLLTAVTDSTGWFTLRPPGAGAFLLRARHVAYLTATDTVQVQAREETLVEVRMGTHAIPLKPIVVLTHVGARALPLEEYRQRMQMNRSLGVGQFITRAQIEARKYAYVSDILSSIAGVVRQSSGAYQSTILLSGTRGTFCRPLFFLDGARLNEGNVPINVDNYVSPSDVEGIEVYSGTAQMPAAYYDPSQCGVVLIWTRRATRRASPALAGTDLQPAHGGHQLPEHLTDVLTPQLAILGLGLLVLFIHSFH